MLRIGGATLCLVLLQASDARAQSDSTASRPAGFFTEVQSARGAQVYRGECGRCHILADHTGPDFKLAWHGQTVRSLFDYLRSTMPDDGPGELNEQQYLDVTAYLLKINGMAAGDAPLIADSAVLQKLVIDIKSASGSAREIDRLASRVRSLLR
jgi:mono/diheme cytochrome c family protein